MFFVVAVVVLSVGFKMLAVGKADLGMKERVQQKRDRDICSAIKK